MKTIGNEIVNGQKLDMEKCHIVRERDAKKTGISAENLIFCLLCKICMKCYGIT